MSLLVCFTLFINDIKKFILTGIQPFSQTKRQEKTRNINLYFTNFDIDKLNQRLYDDI